MDRDTDLRKTIVKRFNIPLTWLDLKRVQDPVNAHDKGLIDTAIDTSNEATYISGWLNDEV